MRMTLRMQTIACAAGLGLIAAIGVLLAPEGLIALSGLPVLMPAAAPPLGAVGRLLLAAAAALGLALAFIGLMRWLEWSRRHRRSRRHAAATDGLADEPAPGALLARLEAALARRGGRLPPVTAALADAVRRIG